MSLNPRIKKYAVALARTLICAAAAYSSFHLVSRHSPYSVVYNRTASIPIGLYLMKEARPDTLKIGDIGCFEYHAPAWAEERKYFPPRFKLCKPIYAGPGAQVERRGGELWVARDGEELHRAAVYAKADSAGRPLPNDALPEKGSISGNHWLMLAPEKPNSFDSRYLGYVPMRDVRYKITPLIVW